MEEDSAKLIARLGRRTFEGKRVLVTKMAEKTIGIDMDNGDNTRDGIVRDRLANGVLRFLKEGPSEGVEVVLYGSPERIKGSFNGDLPSGMNIVPSTSFYAQGEKINRPRKGTSLNNMVHDVKLGNLDGFFSIGDTSKIGLESLHIRDRSVGKPALMTVLPNFSGGQIIYSDLGFTNQHSDRELYSDAVQGLALDIYRQGIMALKYATSHGIDKPRFGVLSNGTEDHKGSDIDKAVDGLVKRAINEKGLGDFARYAGRIESAHCFDGDVDVVFVGGYTGNLLLKHSEGLIKKAGHIVKEKIAGLPWYYKPLLLVSAPALKWLKRDVMVDFDPDKYNGALVMGLKGAVVKGHGASNENAIYHGICRLSDCAGKDFVSGLESVVEKYTPNGEISSE
jgi:glycerol-3-phosphate acyltransferase PlsX